MIGKPRRRHALGVIFKRPGSRSTSADCAPAYDDFHEWVLSLPWVVERPYGAGVPGVRSFAVECLPLERRQLWLVTGLRQLSSGELDVAVIVPRYVAQSIEDAGWGTPLADMPGRHILMAACASVLMRPLDLEALVLDAYSNAMS